MRSSQNSLQSNTTQRPSSAYYPHTSQTSRPNLHQSIPNLKSAPSTQRIQNEETRSGSYPSVNQQNYIQSQYHSQNYPPQNYNTMPNQQQSYPSPNYPRNVEYNMPPTYPNYPNNLHQPLHINANGQRQDEANVRYNTGLLREDIFRHTQNSARNDEMLRYPSTNNVRIQEAQIQSNKQHHDDFDRNNEMRTSKSEDILRQHTQNEMMRYASSGNIRTQESAKVELPQLRLNQDDRTNDIRMNSTIRGTAKMMEMGEEVRRRQNRPLQQHQSYQHLPTTTNYYQQQQQNYYPQHYTNQTHLQNTHNLQNLNLNQQQQHSPYYQQQQQQYNQQQNYYSNTMSPTYPKSPPIAPKPLHKNEVPPELPPTSTHPLFSPPSSNSQDTINKPSFYSNSSTSKLAKDPWAREEQERQAEVRREQARAWQDQQIRELLAVPNRTTQQEEQLRVLQLEREFQRRALEAAEQDDDDTEKVCGNSVIMLKS